MPINLVQFSCYFHFIAKNNLFPTLKIKRFRIDICLMPSRENTIKFDRICSSRLLIVLTLFRLGVQMKKKTYGSTFKRIYLNKALIPCSEIILYRINTWLLLMLLKKIH